MQNKTILTVKDLQEYLGVSRSTAFQLIARQDFPSARLGKRIIIPLDALNEWLKRGGTAPKDGQGA